MSLLRHPTARALLAATDVPADLVPDLTTRLQVFLARYLPHFYRREQRLLASVVLQGKLRRLDRKTAEPIAVQANRPRKPVQHFLGAGAWDDDAVLAELRRHVATTLPAADGVFVVDASAHPKKGTASCGVARQWCGRLGKKENCQVGVYLSYVTPQGAALVDRQLYLPRAWTRNRRRRQRTHVPRGRRFQVSWRLGLRLVDRTRQDLPGTWVVADDEFGRATQFRAGLRQRHLTYVVDVPATTVLRDQAEPPPVGRKVPPWRRVAAWAQAQPRSRWQRISLDGGSVGPRVVQAVETWGQTKGKRRAVERMVVIRTVDREPQVWYTLSNAPATVPLAAVVQAHARRHRIEELFAVAKGEVGLSQYEVRSWVGWHHHMTLSLLAAWFLESERLALGKKN